MGGQARNIRRPALRHHSARHPRRGPPGARNAGSQERTLWGRCSVPTPTPPAPGKQGQRGLPARHRDGLPGERERLTPDVPHNGDGFPPPGTTSTHPRGARPPAGHARQRDSAGPPRPHTRTHGMWAAKPNCPRQGRAAGGGRAPNPHRSVRRRPSQWRVAPPSRGAPPPSPQRARCAAGGGLPRPHHVRPRYAGNRVRLPAPRTSGR